ARAHSGRAVAPVGDEPVVAAFASADDGVAAARELAAQFEARVAAVTGRVELGAGSYRGAAVSGAVRLLERAAPAQVVLDDRTAETLDGRLSPELGVAALAESGVWALVAPGLTYPARADTCPYRGLIAFEPEDGDVYFGREDVVESVLGRLLESRFIALVGASGSGKSSLVRAGLVPAFGRRLDRHAEVTTP